MFCSFMNSNKKGLSFYYFTIYLNCSFVVKFSNTFHELLMNYPWSILGGTMKHPGRILWQFF